MSKSEQARINEMMLYAWNYATQDHEPIFRVSRLRSCNAEVWESENYYYLISYRTMVAFIDKRVDVLYDMLRYVYGYTSTSAQHIAKFNHDYSQGLWGCKEAYRYYPI